MLEAGFAVLVVVRTTSSALSVVARTNLIRVGVYVVLELAVIMST